MDNCKKMKWQKDLEMFFPLYNSFILEGYIDDDQPFDTESGEVGYCRIYEYLDKLYSNNPDKKLRKRVIIYDPTESEEKKFKICDESYDIVEENVEPENPNSETRNRYVYTESDLSQHFWDIIHDDDLKDLFIAHKASGTSLDFSRIHYSVTEGSGRILHNEFLDKYIDICNALFGQSGKENEPSGYLFVIKMTSRLLSRDGQSNGLSEDELMIFRQLLNIAQSIDNNRVENPVQDHKLIILANQIRDLPIWFTDEIANPFIKIITVSRPDEENRKSFFREMLRDPDCFSEEFLAKYREITGETIGLGNDQNINANQLTKTNPIEKKFLAYTNDFSMNMLIRYRKYLSAHKFDDPNNLGFSISTFRVGDMTNPWEQEERIKDMLTIMEKIKVKIKGQDQALAEAQNLLTRAAIGLDRAKNPNAPRLVMFLAGPTGTGKTELCKQIAECIFGSEDRIVRFDMSEFGQEESDQKLFGAPPGYVGYEEGGKLTNAVKKEPFSLILFDEIEKAHNSILDKFLQILGDGRLTDGKGETVRFTDCIIVITSNAGVTPFPDLKQTEIDKLMNADKKPDGEMNMERVIIMESNNASPDEIYREVREHLRYNVKAYFHCGLKRPELYGRIEDSIVYYNYIGKDSVYEIVNATVDGSVKSAKEAMKIAGVDANSLKRVKDKISVYCQDVKVRALGARGIIKSTEKLFTGSLSNFLSDYLCGTNGKSRQSIRGKTLKCSCADTIMDVNDINWDEM